MSRKPFPGIESKSRFSLFYKTPVVNGDEFLSVHFGAGDCRAGIPNLCCTESSALSWIEVHGGILGHR